MTPTRMPYRGRLAGFEQRELLIAMVIVAILAGLAYPSFVGSIRKSRRADAMAALTRVQQAQERFRARSATYASSLDSTGLNLPTDSPDKHYTLEVTNATAFTYVATATVATSSPQASDTDCKVFRVTLNDVNGTIAFSSDNSGGTTNSSAGNPCWKR